MPQTIKSKGGPSAGKDGVHANGASDKRGRGKYALDAGSLLDGILSETQTEARAEESRLNQELQAKQSAEQRKTVEDAELRRRQAEAALAAERDRQDQARYRRQAVLRTMQDLEAEKEAGSLTPTGDMGVAEAAHRPIEFEHQIAPISQSYSHHAVPSRRSPWLMAAMVAGLVMLLGGGATAYFLITSQPAMDPNSYPKTTPSLATVSYNALVVVGVREIPRPEPEPVVVVEVPVAPEDTATAERDRGRGRDRDRDRDRDRETETPPTDDGAPLNLSLDGSGIFDRGSE